MSKNFESFDTDALGHLARQSEGRAITEFVLEHLGQSVVVYGKIDVGKSTVIRDEVISNLEERLTGTTVRYGRYVVGSNQNIELTDSDRPAWEEIQSGGIFFIDEFDNILSDTYENQLLLLQRLAKAQTESRTQITLVLIINEDRLAELHSILYQVPKWNQEMLPIRGIDIANTLVDATSKAANRDIEFEAGLTESIAREAIGAVPSKRLGISPRLVSILAFQIARTLDSTNQSVFTNDDYKRLRKLNGLLWDFLSSQLALAAETGETTREALYAHVSELGDAGPVKGLDNFEDLQARYALEPEESERALEFLENIVGVVRKRSDGRWRLVPSLLHSVVSDKTKLERNENVHLEEDLRGGMANWKRYGIPLSKELLFHIIARRTELALDSEEIEFILDWVLREKSLDLNEARYWLRRLKDPEIREDVLRGALVDSDPDSRSRTAQILSEQECGLDVASYLYELALHDPVREVREVAVDCLKKTDLTDIRSQMLDSAKHHSNYQREAIRALGALSDSDSIELLTSIAKGDESDEPIENRRIAVESLGRVKHDLARDALISIGMQDNDSSLRAVAADRLSKQLNSETIPGLLERLLSWKSLQYSDDGRAITPLTVIRNTVLAMLAVLGNLVPGVLLVAIGRPKTGAVFITGFVIAVAYVIWGIDSIDDFFNWSYLWFFTFVATLFYSIRVLLSDPKNAILSAGDFKWILRLIVYIALAIVAILLDFAFVWDEWYSDGFYFLAAHGFAHILAKQYRTGFLILFIQLLSFGYLLISQFQDGIIYYDNLTLFNQSSIWWNDHLSLLLYIIWVVVFFVTLAWDLVGVLLGHVVLSRRSVVESRRRDLIRNFLCQPPFLSYCLGVLTSKDRATAKRALKSLRQYGSLVESPTLILEEADNIEPYPKKTVIELLSLMRSNQALAEMERLLVNGDARRRELTVSALSKRPTSQSLGILRRQKNKLTKTEKRRNRLRFLYNRLGALGHQLGTTSWLVIILLPLVTFFLFEQSRNYQNPHRQIEKLMMRNCDEQLEKRVSIIDYMPHSITDPDRRVKVRRQLDTVYHHNCGENTEKQKLSIKISIIGALAEIVPGPFDNRPAWERVPDDAISVLLNGLSEGHDGQGIDIHIKTIQVIRSLSLSDLPGFLIYEKVTPDVQEMFVTRLSHALTIRHLDKSDREWVIDFFEGIAASDEVQSHVSRHLKEYVLKPLVYSSLGRDKITEQAIQTPVDPDTEVAIELRKYAVDALAEIGSSNSLDALKEIVNSKTLEPEVRQYASEKLASDKLASNPGELDESDWEATIRAGEVMATEFMNKGQEVPAELRRKLGVAYYLAEATMRTGENIDKAIENLERYYELKNEASENSDARALVNLGYSYIQKSWQMLNDPEKYDNRDAFKVAERVTMEPFLSSLSALRDIEDKPESNSWEVDYIIMYAYGLQAAANLATDDPLLIDEAESLVTKSLAYSGDYAYPYYLLGYRHWKKNEFTAAIESLDDALWRDENDYSTINLLETIARDADYSEAVVQKLEGHVNTSSAYLTSTLALIYHVRLAKTRQSQSESLSDFAKAKELTEKAIELSGNVEDSSLQVNYLEALLTVADYESVINEGKSMLEANILYPESRVLMNYFVLASLYLKPANQLDAKAKKELMESIKIQFSGLKEAFINLPASQGDGADWFTDGTNFYLENCLAWSKCSAEKVTTDALIELLDWIETRSQEKFDAAISKLKLDQGFSFQPSETADVIFEPSG